MISATMSREFGWGLDLSKEDLAQVNETRLGKSYEDAESATANVDQQTKCHLPKALSSENLNMGRKEKAIGAMNTW